MLSKKFLFYIIFVTIIYFLMIGFEATAEPMLLKYNGNEFPVKADFPVKPNIESVDHPNLDNSKIYYFISQEESKEITYTITIASLPSQFKEIDRNTAQIMVESSLNTQINSFDYNLNTESNILVEDSSNYQGYPSMYTKVERNINGSILLGFYRTVYADRFLITIFSNTLERFRKKSNALDFVNSLELTVKKDD